MVAEAEEFADEDKKVKDKVDAKNALESYVYNLKNQLEDEEKGLGSKIEADDKESVLEAVNSALEWLESNNDAEAEDFKEKLKETEGIVNPIISAVYQKSGGAPPSGGDDEGFSGDEL